ncbi:MAG: diaminopimelate epimerase [SAR324 cluster bacterium]|jgi:diaminopimelate epimerase|tara:strand:+ start:138 stop:998 length:861 start_codon:yes stop_codon:yes gene_type:complete
MEFLKYHALGNDYLVLTSENPEYAEAELKVEQVRKICHRNYGLGSDGILVGGKDTSGNRFRLTIFNPDGSKAEKSGNGLRIFARSLWDRELVKELPFQIMTSGGLVSAQVESSGKSVTVEMGSVTFQSDSIPVTGKSREVLNETLEINGEEISFCAATIGNPHCIVLNHKISAEEAGRIGPLLEIHPNFPNRTNVQLLEVLNRGTIRIEIWERGVGYTLASGSSSSAAAAVAHRLGFCDAEIAVLMPGGQIDIAISENYEITMKGSVTRIGKMSLDLECLDFEIPA